MDEETALEGLRDALARGEYLVAYDIARSVVDERPGDVQVRFLAGLALARAGAEVRAAEELEAAWLSSATQPALPIQLAEDLGALGARLAKDAALRATGARRRKLAGEAAARYEAVYDRYDRPYACVNAATMWLLAGDDERAGSLAGAARVLTAHEAPESEQERYWHAATEAEVALILGEPERAREALTRAQAFLPGDLAARASTRRQLALICANNELDPGLLDALCIPGVVHFGGHLLATKTGSGRLVEPELPRIAAEIDAFLDERNVGFAYGSLASGADILCAEAVLARGGELHAFLPFDVAEFVATSVADAGDDWVRRFRACLERATTVTIVDAGPYLGDDVLFEYCVRVAMGRALIRAAFLTADVEQLAVWDGQGAGVVGSTGSAVQTWIRRGGHTHVIDAGGKRAERVPNAEGPRRRVIRAMLFADLKGFSRLHDGQMRMFADAVLTPIAATLARYERDIIKRQTWGDGLHVVFNGVVPAAHCALDLQQAMRTIDWEAAGFPEPLGLRIGAHVGPVLEIHDPICNTRDFIGTHIVRTARIEPRTPEGDVYVTDPFAALLTLEDETALTCEYVGHIPTAKGFGTFPMYVLKPRSG